MRISILFFVLVMIFAGCASSGGSNETGNAMKSEFAGAPQWVMAPNQSGDGDICGVGSASGSRNAGLMRTSAIGRARTEISRSLGVKVKSMLKDYQATTTGGEAFGKEANDEQHIEDVSKQITNHTLSGTEQKKTWISETGTLYTLVCINAEKFKNAISGMQQLNEQVRQAVVERAEKAFDELDKETSK